MSPMPRRIASRDADPADLAAARLRALRPVPEPPPRPEAGDAPGRSGVGVDWSDDGVWGGWVPPAAEVGGSAGPASLWDRLLARLPVAAAGLADRLGPTRSGLLVVGLLLAAAVGVGVLLGRHLSAARVTAAQPLPDLGAGVPGVAGSVGDPSATTSGGPDAGARGTSSGEAGAAGGSIVVDVEGRVRHPGLVTLPSGARVADAIDAAGGLYGHVHDPSLDLAARVGDGQLLAIGRGGAAAAAAGTAAGTGTGSAGTDPSTATGTAPLNLNTASEAQLEALPGVGPVLAGRILAYVQQHGGFTDVSQLQDVPGIGPSHYAEIAPLVTT